MQILTYPIELDWGNQAQDCSPYMTVLMVEIIREKVSNIQWKIMVCDGQEFCFNIRVGFTL